jgi:hypothetical protein
LTIYWGWLFRIIDYLWGFGTEVFHVKKPLLVQDNLFLPITEKSDAQRLERDHDLVLFLGAVNSMNVLLPNRPLDLLADSGL